MITLTITVRWCDRWPVGCAAQRHTVNFWRSMEILSIIPKGRRNNSPDVWAVSQGTWLRRLHVQGDMNRWDGGWSRGGFLADCKFDGIGWVPGSQQQWISRNADWGRWDGGGVEHGVRGCEFSAARQLARKRPYTVVDKTPAGCGEAISVRGIQPANIPVMVPNPERRRFAGNHLG